MFTNLQHRKILKSIQWLLGKAETLNTKRNNRNFTLNIDRGKPHLVRWGQSYETSKINLNFQQIIRIISYDLKHTYTTIGEKTYRQIVGAPMGGTLSSNYANICCAYDEHVFLENNPQLKPRILGLRQIDDALLLITYDITPESKKEAYEFVNGFSEDHNPIYKDGLKCKKQEVNLDKAKETYNFKFIGTHIQIPIKGKSVPAIQTESKNWDNLKSTGRQKFLRLVHARSYTPQSVKVGTIIGEIIRHRTFTNDPILLKTALYKLCIELLSIGYKKGFLCKLLNQIRISYKLPILSTIYKWLKNLPTMPCGVKYSNSHYIRHASKLTEDLIINHDLAVSSPK